jgi:hypothetical protein
MKATLARLGIRNFKPTLRNGLERLGTLQTPRSTRGRSRKSRRRSASGLCNRKAQSLQWPTFVA